MNSGQGSPVHAKVAGKRTEFMERDIQLNDQELDRVADLIYQRAGIMVSRQKRGMVYGRLARRVRQLGLDSFSEYLQLLEQERDGHENELFINALTTNLTAFFRESHHFDLLAEHLAGRKGPIRVWTNAASTGEEAYSLAITLRQCLGEQVDVQVLATDVDTEALARARKGVYAVNNVLKHKERGITRYFLRGQGRQAKWARVKPELAAMVDFAPLNLCDREWQTPGAPFDAIFCRNVMIYFDKDVQARILSRFVPLLKHDGLLFAGHSESFSYISKDFRLLGKTVYKPA